MDQFDIAFYDETTGKYVCNLCDTSYVNKQSLQRHQVSQKKCAKLQVHKMALEINKEIAQKIKTKRVNETAINNTYITNNILNNNNSISNTQNNSQSLKVEVRDFVLDRYDVSHINPKYCEDNKDFFIYDKFLDIIMMNNHNHNIFFTDDRKHAIVYTNDTVLKIDSEKAGIHVLNKLKDCIGEVVCVQKEDIKNKQPQIEYYYGVLKNQCLSDSTLRFYNADTNTFYSNSMCMSFRNRDDKVNGIMRIISKHNEKIRKTMESDSIDIANLKPTNTPMESFISSRNRFKELKE